QVDAAGPAILSVDELLADQPGDVAEARCDGPEMGRASGQVNVRGQPVLDDRGNHRVRFSSSAGAGTELSPSPCSSLHLAGPKDADGLGELPGLPRKAAGLGRSW